MVGDNIKVNPGITYKLHLRRIGIHGLHAAVVERRQHSPKEGLEIAPRLFVDGVTLPGSSLEYKYLFAKKSHYIFLLEIRVGAFTEDQIAVFALQVKGFPE